MAVGAGAQPLLHNGVGQGFYSAAGGRGKGGIKGRGGGMQGMRWDLGLPIGGKGRRLLWGCLWLGMATAAWASAALACLWLRTPLTPEMALRLQALVGPP